MTNTANRDDYQVAQSSSSLNGKERGNNYYGNRDFGEAAKAYQAGLDALQLEEHNNADDSSSLPIALRSNLAMTLLKMEEFQRAADECTRILETDPKNTKGM